MRIQFIILTLLFFSANACKQKVEPQNNSCIHTIIKKDELLGKVRNKFSETKSLSTTIYNYTEGLRFLDYGQCPEAFKTAFLKHIEAWDDMLKVTDKYPDIRGEMHAAFDSIKAKGDQEFENKLDRIWKTWENVEAAMSN